MNSTLSSLNDLITDSAKITDEGLFTELGKLSLTLNQANFNNAMAILEQLNEEEKKAKKDY
mgnify:CR=1 FL=1